MPVKFTKHHGGAKGRKKSKGHKLPKHNPAPSRSSHRRRRRARRNPDGIDFAEFGMEAGTIAGGLLVGVYLNNRSAKWLPAKLRGAGSVAAGVLATMFVKNRAVRNLALATSAMGVLDLLRSNVPALVPLSAEDAGYLLGSAAEYDPSLAAMLGADVVASLFGVDTGAIPMGADVVASPFGVDTGAIPMGADDEGDDLFSDD